MQPFPTFQNYCNYPTQNIPTQSNPIYPYGSMMQPVATPGIAGKYVNDFSEINANDVPMDGRVAVFPKGDMSEIAVKNWESNGTIHTTVFKPVLSTEGNKNTSSETKGEYGAFNDVLQGIQNDIKMLTEKIDRIGKPVKSKKETEDE